MILGFCVSFIVSAIVLYLMFYYLWSLPENVAIPGIIFGSFLISIGTTILNGSENK